MGADKAGLVLGERTLLQRAVEVLADAVEGEVVLATGSAERYPELGLPCVLDRLGDGPLAGLEAVLGRFAETPGGAWVAVLACDLPGADPAVVRRLLARARERALDACLLATAEGPEPLFAVYHTRCLDAVRDALRAGERRMVAFHRGSARADAAGARTPIAVGELPVEELPSELRGCARNVNTPADLAAERRARGLVRAGAPGASGAAGAPGEAGEAGR